MNVVSIPYHVACGIFPPDYPFFDDNLSIECSTDFGLFWTYEFYNQAAIAQVIHKHSKRVGNVAVALDREHFPDDPAVAIAVRVDPGVGEKIIADLKKYNLIGVKEGSVDSDPATNREWVSFFLETE